MSVSAQPTGESSVQVERAGVSEPLQLGVYFENGYEGLIRAEVTVDLVMTVEHEIDIGY